VTLGPLTKYVFLKAHLLASAQMTRHQLLRFQQDLFFGNGTALVSELPHILPVDAFVADSTKE
jgi:hypothetical protein